MTTRAARNLSTTAARSTNWPGRTCGSTCSSPLRYTLEQKRQGFAVLSELQQSVGAHQEVSSIFEITLNAIRGMDKTVVLTRTAEERHFRPSQWVGFHNEGEEERLPALHFEFPDDLARGAGFLLVTRSTEPSPLIDQIQTAFDLPCFLCVPVMGESAPIGLLLSGRAGDMPPKVVELAEVMHRNQRRLLELINQILDLTKFGSPDVDVGGPAAEAFVREGLGRCRG